MDDMADNVIGVGGACGGGCAAVCGCLGCTGGVAGGILTWAYLIWPAMEANPDLTGIGKWLITFLGPGESYVSLWAGVGACALGAIGFCLGACIGSCFGAAASDNTPGHMHKNDALMEQAAKDLLASLQELQTSKTEGQLELQVVEKKAAEVTQSLIEKGIIQPDEAKTFESNLIRVLLKQVTPNERTAMDNNVKQAKEGFSASLTSSWKNVLRGVSKHTMTFRAANNNGGDHTSPPQAQLFTA